jgi:hypothetical protein
MGCFGVNFNGQIMEFWELCLMVPRLSLGVFLE